MSARHDQAAEAIKDSWDFWLSQRDVTVPETIERAVESAVGQLLYLHVPVTIDSAVEAAVGRWLDAHADDGLVDKLAAAIVSTATSASVTDGSAIGGAKRKQAAEALLRKWDRSNQSPTAQERLVADPWRLWRLARDLNRALSNLLADAQAHSNKCITAPISGDSDD